MSEAPGIEASDRAVIFAARNLFREARLPRADATWPALKAGLLTTEARLRRIVREDPEHDEAGVLLQEVRRYLGRHP